NETGSVERSILKHLGGDTPVASLRYTKSAPCFYSASPQGAYRPFSLPQLVEAAQISVSAEANMEARSRHPPQNIKEVGLPVTPDMAGQRIRLAPPPPAYNSRDGCGGQI